MSLYFILPKKKKMKNTPTENGGSVYVYLNSIYVSVFSGQIVHRW